MALLGTLVALAGAATLKGSFHRPSERDAAGNTDEDSARDGRNVKPVESGHGWSPRARMLAAPAA